ncbi:chitinase-like protein 3 [Meriones unguiculatus]|uniref:chitinase-like protein 3 n=1 Tax=Meriones unguiculatus TaxID=10047 RepID=UPI00293E41E9|nr:chitinase-like protein 3 [Meriones unguiculatus]
MDKLILATGLALLLNVQLGLARALNAQLGSSYKLMCWYNNVAKDRPEGGRVSPADIDPCLCTHLIYAFAHIQNNRIVPGTEDLTDYETLNNLKNRNTELKTLLAVGGEYILFSLMASTPELRKVFINSTIDLLYKHNFDGLNLDWQFPRSPEEKQHFTLLLQEMHQAFQQESEKSSKPKLLVTATVAGIISTIQSAYEIPQLSRFLDNILVMTYNLHDYTERQTGENSPLYELSTETDTSRNVDYIMKYWEKNGAAADKLIVGFPTFGQTFSLMYPSKHGIGAPSTGPGTPGSYTNQPGILAYYEVCGFLEKGATQLWENSQQVPYAYDNNDWVGYDNIKSFSLKANWLQQNGFAGAMIWDLGMDDFNGFFCNQGKFPLTSELKKALGVSSTSCMSSVSGLHQVNPPLDDGCRSWKKSSEAVDYHCPVPKE